MDICIFLRERSGDRFVGLLICTGDLQQSHKNKKHYKLRAYVAQCFEFSLVVQYVPGSNPGWGKLAEIFQLGKKMTTSVGQIYTTAFPWYVHFVLGI